MSPQPVTCTVCLHPDVALVHAALAGGRGRPGTSRRKVAAQFGLGHDAINRHLAGRHPGTEVVTGKRDAGAEIADGMTPLEELGALVAYLKKRANSGSAAIDELREYRIALEKYHALRSGGERPKSVTVDEVEGLADFLGELVAALEPFPEARLAALAVLERSSLA